MYTLDEVTPDPGPESTCPTPKETKHEQEEKGEEEEEEKPIDGKKKNPILCQILFHLKGSLDIQQL